jgi:competence protein ComEC
MLASAFLAVLVAVLLLFQQSLPSTGTLAAAALGILFAGSVLAGRRGLILAGLIVLVSARLVISINGALADRLPPGRVGNDVSIRGSICEFPRRQGGSLRFVLETQGSSGAPQVPQRILVTWYDTAPEIWPGEVWQFQVRVRPPRGSANPGAFDYERWLFSERIGATGWVRQSGENRRLPDARPACLASGTRAMLARRMAAPLAGRESAPYVLGLSVGAYQALAETEWEMLRRTGTIHLISISGFHIALVAGPFALVGLLLGRGLLALGFSCRPKLWAGWTAVCAAALYGLLAGFSVPLLRSVVMLLTAAVLLSLRRAVGGSTILAAVLLAVLLVEPFSPLVPGFWLSFAGVAILALVASSSVSGSRLSGSQAAPSLQERAVLGTVDACRLLLLTQLAMTICLAPLMLVFFGQLPLAGAIANLAAVPAFSLVLVPLTLLAAAVAAVSPDASVPLLLLAADCFDMWRSFLAWCAALPFAVWYLPAPGSVALMLGVPGVVWFLWPRPWPARGLGPLLLLGLLSGATPAVDAGGLRVMVLDVGQGLSVLVQTASHALLYDAGPLFRNGDAGDRIVVPVLQALGIRRLDQMLISHADADHRGGAWSVIGRYPLVHVSGAAPKGGDSEPCTAGQNWNWDGVDFEILHPAAGSGPMSDNNGSCVLLISAAGVRVLLPGDIEAKAEQELVTRGVVGPVNLLLAPHHGSRSSSSPEFVAATSPHQVVFATGFGNRWHFPVPEVVGRWRAAGACLLNTAEEGALQFDLSAPGVLSLSHRQRAEAAGVWLARPARIQPCS